MYRVVNDTRGTAFRAFHPPDETPLEVAVCGKTGTAQTAPQRIDSDDDGLITRADRIVRTGDTAWFAGFAPRDDPQIAFAVAVEYVPGGGSVFAAPLARRLVVACEKLGLLDDGGEKRYARGD
jgi:penicillin-binding protein 2